MKKKYRYRSGEYPQYGDIVRGVPNNSIITIAGIVTAFLEDAICIIFLKRDGSGEVMRFYGMAYNFELLARNAEGIDHGKGKA